VAEPHDTGTSERLDALRRRLYRPGSSEADLRRYLDERDAIARDEPVDDTPPRALPQRRRLVMGASGLGLALVVALTVAVDHGAPARVAAKPATPAATAGPPLTMDVGDGQTLTVPAGAVTTSTATPTSVRGTAVVGRLFEGSGNAVVSIDPPSDPLSGGSAVVLASSSSRIPVAWRVLSTLRLGRAFSGPMVLARGISAEPSGAPVPQTFRYQAESPPARIAVAAPHGTRWSLLIAVAGEAHALR
jgi:hypothetical protein